MRVLLSDTTFSYIFPGGKQTLAFQLYNYLNKYGIITDYENWHDPKLTGDIIHFLGFNDFNKIKILKERGFKLVYTHLLDGITNLSSSKRMYHLIKNKIVKNLFPEKFNAMFAWKALKYFDALIYSHENDRQTAIKLYNVDPPKAFVIPMALEFIDRYKGGKEDVNPKYLVSLASIVPRKNAIFTARICKHEKIPIKFIGPSFGEQSAYFQQFKLEIKDSCVEYLGFLPEEEKIEILKKASGFVLLSFGESGCISIYEAAAAGLPLLLSNLPWAKNYENPNNISFCSNNDYDKASKIMRDFYERTRKQNEPSFTVHSWDEIIRDYESIYYNVLARK